jgi:chemotaxis response regulator CheB
VRPTVLIVDDHEAFRASARALLQAGAFDVIGEASDGTEAIAAVTALRPAIVLLDVQLPGLDGLAVAERLAQAADPPVVVLSSGRDVVGRAWSSGDAAPYPVATGISNEMIRSGGIAAAGPVMRGDRGSGSG